MLGEWGLWSFFYGLFEKYGYNYGLINAGYPVGDCRACTDERVDPVLKSKVMKYLESHLVGTI